MVESALTIVSATFPQPTDALSSNDGVKRRDLSLRTPNVTLAAPSHAGWVACNLPPQYRVQVSVRDCGILYHRYAAKPGFNTKHAWQAISTPIRFGEESDVCDIRLENYDRLKYDRFSTLYVRFGTLFLSQSR